MLKFLIPLLIFVPAQAGVTNVFDAPMRVHPKGAVVRLLNQNLKKDPKSAFIAHLTVPAGGKVPLHRDETEEYLYVLEGSGTIWINGKKQKIKSGDFVAMAAKAEVKFENGDQPLIAIQIFAPPGPEKKYKSWELRKGKSL